MILLNNSYEYTSRCIEELKALSNLDPNLCTANARADEAFGNI